MYLVKKRDYLLKNMYSSVFSLSIIHTNLYNGSGKHNHERWNFK